MKDAKMKLNINDEKAFSDPSPQVLRRELRGVDADEFAILSSGEERFLQMYRNDDESFQFEYRDGAYDKHFGADTSGAKLDDLTECFVAYLEGDVERWKAAFNWQRIEFDPDFQGDDFQGDDFLT